MTVSPSRPSIPACSWTRSIGLGWETPYTVRYASNLDDGPWHGMPLGGFGAGCIGRSHRGDFNLWHIDGGEHVFQPMAACQFLVFEQLHAALNTETEGSDSLPPSQTYALCTQSSDDTSLQQWQWYPASDSTSQDAVNSGNYHALYPRSWFTYQNVFTTELTCEQFSPILPNNYQETSYPVAVFEWTAHNPTDRPLTLSIALTWENMCGWFTNTLKAPEITLRDDGSPVYDYEPKLGDSKGNTNQLRQSDRAMGCVMGQHGALHTRSTTPAEGDGQWAIATFPSSKRTEVFYHTHWNPVGSGAEIWETFSQDGSLPNIEDSTPAHVNERIASALAVRVTLQPGETLIIPFVLSWDFPVTEFAEGTEYLRRYTDFFGAEGTHAWAIATHALAHYPQWKKSIQDWQSPILNRSDLSDIFKIGLFNELYDLTSGGTLWSAATEHDPYGQFGVLECFDYCWYESLDVRLYGSFALLMLWPELDKAVLRAFARAIPASDERKRVIGYYFTIGDESPLAERKTLNATPHDLGAPNEHPWEKTNYTAYQDCNLWKDLGSDFVLQVYRDFLLTGKTDYAFLADCWEAIAKALTYLKSFDLDQDGIPENSGAPDQTFDDWRMKGMSAYCGGLWIAALEAAIAIGNVLLNPPHRSLSPDTIQDSIHTFKSWLQQSRQVYHSTLWNGQFYQLDSESNSPAVMADQLCGQFYARLLNLPDVVPSDCAETALQSIYQSCFLNFHQGKYGIANGVLPDGSPVNPNDTHPLEVWTGINFGIAAFLLQMEHEDQAMRVTETVIQQIYDNGLQFRTPEAITSTGTFRACHYLRAMAIWLVYGVQTGFEGF